METRSEASFARLGANCIRVAIASAITISLYQSNAGWLFNSIELAENERSRGRSHIVSNTPQPEAFGVELPASAIRAVRKYVGMTHGNELSVLVSDFEHRTHSA